MSRLAQGPLEPWRGHVDRVLVQVRAQEVGDPRAERVVHPLRVVDEDAEARRGQQFDREHLDPRDLPLDRSCDLSRQLLLLLVRRCHLSFFRKKWAPCAHFAKPVKCGVCRIAAKSRPRIRHMEELVVKHDGVSLAASYSPAGSMTLVALHGAGAGTRDYFLYRNLHELLPSAGIGVLTFDRRGEGESTGDVSRGR